jgi:hypothetical protein
MQHTITNYNGQEFNLDLFFSQEFKGRGGWNINCDVRFNNQNKTFKHYITDATFIDSVSDFKADGHSHQFVEQIYFDKAFDYMQESILEWVEEQSQANESETDNQN